MTDISPFDARNPSHNQTDSVPLNFKNFAQFWEQIAAVVDAFTTMLIEILKASLLLSAMGVAWLIPLPGTGPIAMYYLYGYLPSFDSVSSAGYEVASSLGSLVTRTYGTFFASNEIVPNDLSLVACKNCGIGA